MMNEKENIIKLSSIWQPRGKVLKAIITTTLLYYITFSTLCFHLLTPLSILYHYNKNNMNKI